MNGSATVPPSENPRYEPVEPCALDRWKPSASENLAPELTSTVRGSLDTLAAKILAEEPQIDCRTYFDDSVMSGLGPWPSLVIEDHSGIALHELSNIESYGFRAMMLAAEGDMVVLPKRDPAFEAYCRGRLGLGSPTVLVPEDGVSSDSLALCAANDPETLRRIVERARQCGGLNIIPYMGSGQVWSLAKTIARLSGVAVRVAASLPRLTRRVNDKLWFAGCVARALGVGAEPEVRSAYGPAALASLVRELSRRHAGLAVRIPDAASSLGTVLVAAESLAGQSLGDISARLRTDLSAAAWRGDFPLMVTAWEEPILASPSVHLWIPLNGAEQPTIEAILEQRLVGCERAYSGAEPSALPAAVRRAIASQAAQLGYLFQKLGYFGRCSFDAILIGRDPTRARVHWVECNGRWGGVSIPLTLARRLSSGARPLPFLVLEKRHQKGKPIGFDAVLQKLGKALFVRGEREQGVVILSPTFLEQGTGFMIMILGREAGELHQMAGIVTQRLSMMDP